MVAGSSHGLASVDSQAEGPVPLDSTEHHQPSGECWFLNQEVVRPPSSRIRGLLSLVFVVIGIEFKESLHHV